MDEKRQFLETTLARLLEWIRSADSKIAPILAIDTSMLAIIAALVPKPTQWTIVSAVIGVIAVVPLLVSLLFLFLAAFPHTKGPKPSIFYFEGIKAQDPDDYLAQVHALTNDQVLSDLAKQCHRNAEIASIKYGHIKTAITAMFISVIPWLVLVFLLYRGT